MLKRAVLVLALIGVAAVALAMRSTSLPEVFAADGRVYLDIHDSAYHARVALYDFANFPSVLRFDPWVAYPDGAAVQNPFLFDWAVAATARLSGSSLEDFERTAAWVSPVLAALGALVVFAMGRLLGGNGLGLAAAGIFAVIPASVRRSQVGDLDHHAAVALLGALLLWGSLELTREPGRRNRTVVIAALLGLARVAVVLTWSGSLLYLLLCEGALILTAIVQDRRDVLWAQSAGALAAAAGVALTLAAVPGAADAPFATTTLSWFHVVTLATAGAAGALLALVLARAQSLSLAQRLAAGSGIGAGLLVAVLLFVPGLGEGLLPSLSFLTGADEWAAHNPEQQPVFRSERALLNFGILAHMLPFTVLGPAILVYERSPLGPGICLLCWTVVLGTLAIFQIRFSNEFATAASLSLALIARYGSQWLEGFAPAFVARLGVGLAIGLLLLPGFEDAGAFRRALAHARGEIVETERMSARRTLAVFAEMLREATPEATRPEQPGARPGYGVLAPASFGHTLHYYARRATPANNFGPYLDREKFLATRRFYDARDEAEAISIAEELKTRYAMSYAHELAHQELFLFSLHERDRAVGGEPAERLRLIVEGPARGMVFARHFPSLEMPEETIPYKLFEIVTGAVLEAHGEPGTELRAEVELSSNLGRRFVVSASARADAAGVARLRVPYATLPVPALPTQATGPYRVRFGAAESEVHVSESDVQEGGVVRVGSVGPEAGIDGQRGRGS